MTKKFKIESKIVEVPRSYQRGLGVYIYDTTDIDKLINSGWKCKHIQPFTTMHSDHYVVFYLQRKVEIKG